MTTTNQNKFLAYLPYIFSVLSFFGGGAIVSLTKINQLDNLSHQVQTLNDNIEKLSKKLDESNAQYTSMDKRVSKVEYYLFENKQPAQETSY
jgi:outer membrane murein-binding lipoprotein Lpp